MGSTWPYNFPVQAALPSPQLSGPGRTGWSGQGTVGTSQNFVRNIFDAQTFGGDSKTVHARSDWHPRRVDTQQLPGSAQNHWGIQPSPVSQPMSISLMKRETYPFKSDAGTSSGYNNQPQNNLNSFMKSQYPSQQDFASNSAMEGIELGGSNSRLFMAESDPFIDNTSDFGRPISSDTTYTNQFQPIPAQSGQQLSNSESTNNPSLSPKLLHLFPTETPIQVTPDGAIARPVTPSTLMALTEPCLLEWCFQDIEWDIDLDEETSFADAMVL
ncbi:hypothetical protein C8J56DRAFT_1038770 [Mycena floridula]|nr:hypothetical protein C8J56DRAFT_1038770 [Mycena floridula]